MPREFRQDVEGYNVAIRHLEKEYKRALRNTTRSKTIYQGYLDRIQWCLDLARREQRELLTKNRPSNGKRPRPSAAA